MRVDEAKTLNPGLLRDRIRIQEKVVSSRDSYGADVFTWTDHQVCYAQVRELSGRELNAARQVWSDAQFELRMHYLENITTAMRVHVDRSGKNLDILSAHDPYGTRRVLQMIAKEVT